MFAPEERINSVKEAWLRIKKDKAQLCLDVIRKDLKDPDSARIVSFEKIVKDANYSKTDTFLLKYRAKNSYGAYNIAEEHFSFIGDLCTVDVVYKLDKDINELKSRNINKKIVSATSIEGIHAGTGKVIKTMNSNGYTYIQAVNDSGAKVWLAMNEIHVAKGDNIEYPELTQPMINFKSKSLNMTFDKIFFVTDVKIVKQVK